MCQIILDSTQFTSCWSWQSILLGQYLVGTCPCQCIQPKKKSTSMQPNVTIVSDFVNSYCVYHYVHNQQVCPLSLSLSLSLIQSLFDKDYFYLFILLFNLFLLLFMNPIVLFSTIYRSYFTILINFYLYLQYFQ